MSRESYEVSEAAAQAEWEIWDTCKHGNYPGEGSCGCTMPAMLERLTAKGITKEATDTF